eukprot:CAMPEP_0196999608 /NCGR_PEP_ID=MMETSP1380-20130617/4747_1 /TAXON_ID=5936 /ORGANISM="Euplotes crassus, Strain CT5" /LENGTH=191 /DNA_ID=CAMNT_0042416587 /DNA_START=2207 /DNA_END=2778 /DNA_ORIENTATION=+
MNDVGGLVLLGLHYNFMWEGMSNEEYYQYAQYCMRAIIGLIVLNIICVVAHWIFELLFRLFPFCCLGVRKKLQKADADDEEVNPEAEVLSSEESVEPKVVIQPPVEIVIPAAGVLVEKGQEYQMQQDIVVEKEKKKMPKEEFKEAPEIKPSNVDNDDEDLVIDQKKTPTGLNNTYNATGTTLFGNTGGGAG